MQAGLTGSRTAGQRPPTGRRWRRWVALGCTAAGIAAITVAWQQPGFPAVPPLAVDDSVWVVNEDSALVGRINTGIGELDSATAVRAASNILQDPTTDTPGSAFVVDNTKHELQSLDTTTVTFGTRVSIPDNAMVQLGGGTLAVTDRADGRLWVGTSAAVGSVDARVVEPVATLGALPVIAVSTAGTVFATAAGSSTLVRVTPGADPTPSALPAGALSLGTGDAPGTAGQEAAADIQLTTVGETPVLLDRADSSLRIGDQRFPMPLQATAGRSAVLQQPGPVATEVLIAAADGLYAVGLADGAARTITAATGTPVAPVTTTTCSYSAWQLVGAAVQAMSTCGKAPGQLSALEASTGVTGAVFRRHADAVVLGSADTGKSWVANDGYRLVNNWSDVQPPESADTDQLTEDDPESNKDDLPALPPDCTNVPVGAPQAVDDDFGVRAGRATVLRVLDNDPSVDCTSVVINRVSALAPELGSVAIVAGGSSIQLTVPAAATASSIPPIEYEVSNGRGGTSKARVAVKIVDPAESKAPERIRRSVASTEVNGTVAYNVLDDYRSPVGDDLYLQSATTDSADLVSFRPDGTITYRNTGGGAGTDSEVNFTVSDGSKQVTGTLIITLAAEDSSTPVVYPSFVSAVVGSTALATPLRSVVSAANVPAVISTVQPEQGQPGSAGATALLDPIDGSVAITATAPGDYYFTFEASTGGRAVTGVLRAHFVEPTDQSRSVVPMTDIAYLPANGEAVIDPLANDDDPDGQGLAVRDIQLAANGPITAAVVDLHLVQVTAARVPKAPVEIGYSVFDGTSTQAGEIRVVPVDPPKVIPPPVAVPIAATVRAGDAVTIPVARYASSQDGSPITAELDASQVATLPGRVFSTGDTIRYLAPADAQLGPVTFSYTAVAGSSTPLVPVQSVSSVTIDVTAADPATNSAPNTPNPITARVFTGGIIDISVPLAGTDPDGDWVVLSSIEQPEAPLGSIAVSGADTLTYQAFGGAGVDRIRYLAVDPAGLSTTGEITVLVAEPGELARPPVAPDIAVAVRPGASIRVDPLSVVVDPGGLPVEMGTPAFTLSALQVEQDEQSLIITAPPEKTVASFNYQVINSKGLRATGSVRVDVTADAPVPLPVARDVFVKPADLTADNETVDVDLSGSITNRSGRRDELVVEVDPLSAGQATLSGPAILRVTISQTRQIVAYRITDAFGSAATAFVVVPPREQLVGPQLIAGVPPISLQAGQSVEVEIGDYVTVGGGKDASIAASPEPRATQGKAVRTSGTTLTLSAPTTAGGQAAVFVPIDDGAGSVVVLSLPMQIVPRVVPPPKLDSSELDVEAGTSASVDLAALTQTADAEQSASLSYGVGAGSGGVQSGQQGSITTVTVAADVPRGTVLDLPIQVIDGEGRDGKATLTVTVTGSRQPLPTVLDQQIDQGRAGVQVAADLLTGSSDPIGLGLTVGAVTLEQGQVSAGPVVTGSSVSLTPAAGFVGTIVVAAEIFDGTKDPDRLVTARLRVSIQDRPSAPGVPAPVEGTVTANSVQLAWAPADANGAAIDGYTLTGSGIAQDCPGSGTSCTVDGLTAGQPYVFVVTARNAVGQSPPSAPSAAIVPDAAPTAPGAPVASYLAKSQLSVSWSVPTGAFTPVTGISLQVLQNGAVIEVRDNVSGPLILNGLDPGAEYSFQVRASNREGSSDWSAVSAAIVPSGTPAAPAGVTAEFVFDAGRRGAQVSWSPPTDTGGEPVQGYTLLVNGAVNATGDADFRSAFVPIDSDAAISVAVLARNSRGDGPPTAPVDVRPFSRPSAVRGLALTAQDAALSASWSPADAPGSAVEHYDYRVDGAAWTDAGAGTSVTISGLTNGQTYRVEVRACNSQAGFAEDIRCGPAADAVSGKPYGGLAAPTVTAALVDPGGQRVAASWTFPTGNGRDVSKQTVRVSGDVKADLDPGALSWTSEDIGYGKSVKVTVQYCVTGPDECSAEATETVSTPKVFSLPTIALAPLTGTCGAAQQYPGEWLTDQNCKGGTGSWVVAPAKVEVLCRATGESYPSFPAGNPAPLPFEPLATWYLTTDQKWFRTPAVGPAGNANIPPC
ncbi:MAG: fibronectin type III domain-containing protein [Nakamurella sp.]